MTNDIILEQYYLLVDAKDKKKKEYNKARKNLVSFLNLLNIDIMVCKECKGTKTAQYYSGSACGEDYYESSTCKLCGGTGVNINKRVGK